MSLRRKLYRLEASKRKDPAELLPHLCRLAGITDAILWSPRLQSPQNFTAICIAQRDYHANGVAFMLEGSDQSTWKASERLRGALCNAGWCESLPNGKLKITLLGDMVARQLSGVPTIDNPITEHLFEKIAELQPERTGGWVSEASLFSLQDDTDTDLIHSITEFIQPLLVHRVFEATSSTTARCFYRRVKDTLPVIEDYPRHEYDEVGSDEYTKAYCKQMSARKNLEYNGPQCVIPLSATR